MTEKNYVVNVKTTKGTIVTARGDTAEELISNINALVAEGASDAILTLEQVLTGGPQVSPSSSAVNTVLDALGGTVINETAPPAFAPVPPPTSQAPASPAVGAKMCQHGPMIVRKGSSAKGEWKAYMCPTPKGTVGQCDPVWLNRSMPEWNAV